MRPRVVGRKVVTKKMMFDPETGQPVEMILIGKLDQEPLDKGYVKVFHAFLDSVVNDKEIAGKSIRLLLYMMRKLEYNTLTITLLKEDAKKALNITDRTYYKWIGTLMRKGIIERIGLNVYRLKPSAVVRGEMWKALRELKGEENSEVDQTS